MFCLRPRQAKEVVAGILFSAVSQPRKQTVKPPLSQCEKRQQEFLLARRSVHFVSRNRSLTAAQQTACGGAMRGRQVFRNCKQVQTICESVSS